MRLALPERIWLRRSHPQQTGPFLNRGPQSPGSFLYAFEFLQESHVPLKIFGLERVQKRHLFDYFVAVHDDVPSLPGDQAS